MTDPRFDEAVRRFAAADREDPRVRELAGESGEQTTESAHYHRRLTFWLSRFAPAEPSPALLLAAHCQHIRRWTIPRSSYEEGRSGYKRWRSELARFHADEAGKILREVGYEEAVIDRLRELLTKQRLKSDPEVQALEDAVCLVFLENEFAEFATKHDDDKLVDIVQKTWAKMSAAGHEAALELTRALPPHARTLLARALA